MLKPTGKRLNEAVGSVRFVAADSLLVSGLLLLGVYVLWNTGFVLEVRVPSWVEQADRLMLFTIPWQPVVAVVLGLVAYWALQALGRDRIAFWLIALAAALPHGLPAWSHNRIGWHELFELQAGLGERSLYWDMALFVAYLVGLIALHRIVGIKELERRMLARGVGPLDKQKVMRYERFMLIGLLAAGLLLAGLMVFIATVLARYDGLLDGSPLAVVTLGGSAALLLALTLLFWFRGREDPRDEEVAMRADTKAGS